MKRSKIKRIPALLALLIALSGLAGCGTESTNTEDAASTELTSLAVEYSDEDMDDSWDTASAVTINLSGSTATISGTGAVLEENKIRITEAGTYVLSGTFDDGQILIEADEKDKVQLVLNGVEIKNSDGPAIYSVENDKVILTVAKGTTNRVEDGTAYTLASGEEEPNAAIFSKSDLTINGSGTLLVNGNYKNGIVSKDDLVITGGNVTVLAVNDGIKGRDSIAIKDGSFTITAKDGDALQATNNEDTQKGWISIDGGKFVITATGDGLQAESLLQVTGGTLAVTSTDDALHSNTNIRIASGDMTLSTGDDGMHADSSLLIEDGSVLISESYEGLEAGIITVNGGTIDLTSKDDGFNAAGGNDASSLEETAPAKDSFAEQSDYYIRIKGGDITVNASGDGIDPNGSLYFDGGTVKVSGPTNDGNGPLDYNGVCEVTGGTLAIAGSSGMAQAPSDTSTQCSVTVYYSTAQSAGTLASLIDADGKTIVSFAPKKEYSSIVFSSADLVQGKTYTLLSGKTELADVKLTNIITKISQDGTAVTGGTGGQKGEGTGTKSDMGTPPSGTDGERPAPPDGSTPPAKGEAPPDGTQTPDAAQSSVDSTTSATTQQ